MGRLLEVEPQVATQFNDTVNRFVQGDDVSGQEFVFPYAASATGGQYTFLQIQRALAVYACNISVRVPFSRHQVDIPFEVVSENVRPGTQFRFVPPTARDEGTFAGIAVYPNEHIAILGVMVPIPIGIWGIGPGEMVNQIDALKIHSPQPVGTEQVLVEFEIRWKGGLRGSMIPAVLPVRDVPMLLKGEWV